MLRPAAAAAGARCNSAATPATRILESRIYIDSKIPIAHSFLIHTGVPTAERAKDPEAVARGALARCDVVAVHGPLRRILFQAPINQINQRKKRSSKIKK